MSRKKSTFKNYIIISGVLAALSVSFLGNTVTVQASTISQLQDQIKKDQQQIDSINNTISGLEEEKELADEQISDLNAEIINMMTSIGMKNDEIAAKEKEIANKQVDIDQAQLEYEAAKQREEEQYEALKVSVQFMYENNTSTSLLTFLLEHGEFADIMNQAEYIERVYQYGRELLLSYEEAKNEVHTLWEQLVTDKTNLENDKAQLEADRAYLQTLKGELDVKLAEKKAVSADYEAEISRYQKQANDWKKKMQKEANELKKLQEKSKKPVTNSNAVSGNYTDTGYVSTIDGAGGSELGKKIAKYGCQFIGNPYVYGGTSLTSGADCSGFTYRIYKDFGYSLPRTSFEQRSTGKGVSYDQAQPGDLVCYEGHVGLYIGGGKIVHASSAKTGIKISNATYRPILAVRRII